MNVLVVEPGIMPYEKEINGLREMQEIVGGRITTANPFGEDIEIISCDGESEHGMIFNRSLPEEYGGIYGPFFICGVQDGKYCSLSPSQIEKYKNYFQKAEILLGYNDRGIRTLKIPSRPVRKQLDSSKQLCQSR